MIEIKLADQSAADKLCKTHGIDQTANIMAYLMADSSSEENLGFCLFYIDGEKGSLLLLKVDEEGLLLSDGLLRATLSLMLDRGVNAVKTEVGLMGAGEEKRTALLLKRLQFEQKDGIWSLELTENYFKGHC